MGNLVDNVIQEASTTHILDRSDALSLVARTYALVDPQVGDLVDYECIYGNESVDLVRNFLDHLASHRETPSQEIELMILHALVVAPVVASFAPGSLASKQETASELEQLSDYLYSRFSYDRASDLPTSTDDLYFMRGSVVEYYVGAPTDAAPEHLKWLGALTLQISTISGTLENRCSVDRELVMSLLSADTTALVEGVL